MNHRELLPIIGLIALASSIATCSLNNYKYKRVYRQAETLAVQRYGDKQPPFTEEEKTQWYKDMSVKPNHKPDIGQLEKYLSNNEK
jgi:hypothetical protein